MLHLDPPRLPRRPDSGTARWAVVSVLPGSCADDAILDIELVAAFMSMVDLPGLHAAGNIAFTERAFVVVLPGACADDAIPHVELFWGHSKR